MKLLPQMLQIEHIDATLIDGDPSQPRAIATNEELVELAGSIGEHGLFSPILVERKDDGRYRRVAGYRRFEAMHRILNWSAVPCIVRVPSNELERSLVALIENVQREDLSDYEVARAIEVLIKMHDLTEGQVADRLQRSRTWVNHHRRIFRDEELGPAVSFGRITYEQARKLLMARNKVATAEESPAIVRDPYPSEELDAPKEQELPPRPSADRTRTKVGQNGQVLPRPSLRELIPVPPEVTLERMMGLGELVAEIHDDTQALRMAILEDGEAMDDRVWERVEEAATVLREILVVWPKARIANRN